LNGGEDKIEFKYFDARGGTHKRAHRWEGILPNLERRYRETESQTVRDELAKYLGWRPCISCGGARLNEPARFVFVDNRSLPDAVRMTVLDAYALFQSMHLEGWRAEIATKIVREVGPGADGFEFFDPLRLGMNARL